MRKIERAGNMPAPISAFAKQLTGNLAGQKETEFWEAYSITEFEKNASEIGYEIIPAMDMNTKRGYLVGFDVEDSVIIGLGNQSYAQLKMYFVEVSEADFTAWVNKIKTHREMQQEEYFLRKARREAAAKPLDTKVIKETQ